MARVLLGLGSNLGDRSGLLKQALEQLQDRVGQVLRWSEVYETAPVGGPAHQPPYLNAAALLESALEPHRLLTICQQIETDLGRERLVRWGPRTIDIDILLYDQLVLDSPQLTIPHPRLAVRRFALQPAAEIAPTMLHPQYQRTIGQLWHHVQCSPRRFWLIVPAVPPALITSLQQELPGWHTRQGAEVNTADQFVPDSKSGCGELCLIEVRPDTISTAPQSHLTALFDSLLQRDGAAPCAVFLGPSPLSVTSSDETTDYDNWCRRVESALMEVGVAPWVRMACPWSKAMSELRDLLAGLIT
jgi:2-amino-4-hydroxy-6-hydroxymethyldihydropteridine diphosphokinase